MSCETQIQIALRQVDLSLARARYFEKRIETGAYKDRVVRRGGLDGPVLTGDELKLDELSTMNRHIQLAQQNLDYAQELQSKAPPHVPASELASLKACWAEAYAAFQGAFDTPVARRKQADEYSEDARLRLRAFNDQMKELL